ncbi:hypothetical protein [Rhodococcus sp. UNC363MFTsu5.1]|uniref:hypothetical protein n=1 Tax=Rhodococcus sp. UNC363MFTsu5.1 TaxID=1449069 RepID=UPI0004880574|nr:hypothetical protein [Rhodococcus sp. UNC363MFTsu5.1]
MRKSLNTGIVRKRAGFAAAGLAVAAAVTVPGVAWANDAIPQGGAVAVQESGPAVAGAPLDAATCAATAVELSPEALQKMIEDGTAVPAVATVPATPAGEPGQPLTDVLTEGVQRLIADGTAMPAVTSAPGTPAGEPGLALTKVLTDEEVQRMIADGTITRAVPADELPADAQMLTIEMDESVPAGAVTVTRAC